MKALILAAGFATRLRPYSAHTPKALFPYAGSTLLDRHVTALAAAGCQSVVINAHYRHAQIKAHVAAQSYPIPVSVRVEPEILGTGGALTNLADFWDSAPFVVINADIVTDIDLAEVFRCHQRNKALATLVLHDRPEFNMVRIDDDHRILSFESPSPAQRTAGRLAFTGIHVIDPALIEHIPPGQNSCIIDVYRQRIAAGQPPAAYIAKGHYWEDLGTVERYRKANYQALSQQAFEHLEGAAATVAIDKTALAGDGSDRRWYRLSAGSRQLIMADHGIRPSLATCEADSFVHIGRHLASRNLPVPRIVMADPFCGQVFVEDLGDRHLQQAVASDSDPTRQRALYQQVIQQLVRMSLEGAKDFDPAWCYQSARYDRQMIREKECDYFLNAFLKGYAQMDVRPGLLADDFDFISRQAATCSDIGFMHRDFQSRNILIHQGRPYFIDFQGGRLGPLQYDLASLTIDPYVNLSLELQQQLVADAVLQLGKYRPVDTDGFERAYRLCRLTRNLQILGAFAYLSREKQKSWFESHIPAAVASLHDLLRHWPASELKALKKIVNRL